MQESPSKDAQEIWKHWRNHSRAGQKNLNKELILAYWVDGESLIKKKWMEYRIDWLWRSIVSKKRRNPMGKSDFQQNRGFP